MNETRSTGRSAAPTPDGGRAELGRLYQLLAQIQRRSNPSLLSWSGAFRREKGRALDFELFPFQRELYEAFGSKELRTVDVMKSGQCGISAAAVSLALYAGDQWGASVLYVLPGFEDAHDFSDTRVKTAIEDSAYLASRVSLTDNKGLKRIGDAFVYFRGSGSEKKALSIPADILILDEYDRLDQRRIPTFRKRLGAPTSLKLERRFSNPSYSEAGIHGLYLLSDQREWQVRCGPCRHEASIRWDEAQGEHFVDEEKAARVCGGCRRALSRESIATGRWAPTRPKTPMRGYHVSKLIVPDEDISALIREHHKTDEDSIAAHYNYDLGLPYSPRGGSLSRDLVLACRRDYVAPESYGGPSWVTAGVDVGRVLHVRISRWTEAGHAVALYIGEIDGFTDLALLWERYAVNFGLIDERPEERKAREFMESRRGQAMLVRWSGDDQRDPVVLDKDRGLLLARRTGACDRLVAAITAQTKYTPRDLPARYVSQLTAPHRVVETNARGQKVARYVSERDDHYFFAELYDLLAAETRGGPAYGGFGPAPESIRDEIRRRQGLWV